MKKIIVMALMGMVAAGCSNEYVDLVENGLERDGVTETTVAPVRVHVSGFTVDQTDFTRSAEDVANYSGVNVVTLAFYDGSTEVYKVRQERDGMAAGETFGEFSLYLPMGSYQMVAVACKVSTTSPFTLTSATVAAFTGAHAQDTFVASGEVAITSTDDVDISATLERIVSQLKVASTDEKTSDVQNVRMTLSGGSRSFNPTTGWAIGNAGFANTVGFSTSGDGEKSSSLTYLFLTSDDQTMDVTIETLDAQGDVIYGTTVTDVPFKRNRKTVLTGALYTNAPLSGGFKVETDWLEDYEMGF